MGIEGAGYSCCHNYFTMAERTELIIIKSVTDEGGGGEFIRSVRDKREGG